MILAIDGSASTTILGFLLIACLSTIASEMLFKSNSVHENFQEVKTYGYTDSHELGKSILRFSAPFLVWGIFAWAHQYCDRWALLTFKNAGTVGAYTVIAQLAYYPLVFGSGFLGSLFIPIAYQRAGGLQSGQAIGAANKILIIMVSLYISGACLLVLIFFLFHRHLVLFISSDRYADFSYLLPVLTAAWSFYYLGQMLAGFGMLINKPGAYIQPIMVCGLLAVVLTFTLADPFGAVGVTVALSIAGLVYAVWCLIIARRLISAPQKV